jgi:hypothetical protein
MPESMVVFSFDMSIEVGRKHRSAHTVFWEDDTGEIRGAVGRPGETCSGLGRLRGKVSCWNRWPPTASKEMCRW